ncbi:LysR family transcriptional regulator [Candidatus Thiodictyon syntrophicum]|jgi:DNA-binding transcriptional LysR family regulator|uniref:LysR family transcriptional regulator n=1 Tax=Candidatus Thiodictyon syntrophicum TaxID=1166950 RepID=A0A2K8U5M9_9GAMM|nr:LysR family transcriptional regulator [Candidatus Thiodictyon syntrophicum]AUB80883.1 LysR family transcriptional regulator [Candidatus Thiodictyon syntrophicum]
MASGSQIHYKQNRLKQLRAFCHAARTGSVSAAADKIFLSQPTVSLQIQALEREFDTVLFERRGPKIRLTPEGQLLFEMAAPLVEGMDRLHDAFAVQCGRVDQGALNIAAGESTILYILPEPVRSFVQQYPGIELKLHNVTGRDGLAMLRADEADLAVGSLMEVPDDINYRPFVTYRPTLITPKDHPLAGRESVTLAEIAPFEMILPPRHLSTWRMVDLVFKQHNLAYRVTLEAGGWEVIKKYVELGLGISIVTDVCLTGEENLARVPLDQYFPKRSYGIVQRRGKFLSPQTKCFVKILDRAFADRVVEAVPEQVGEEPRWDDAMLG